jgi:hypothetical protein
MFVGWTVSDLGVAWTVDSVANPPGGRRLENKLDAPPNPLSRPWIWIKIFRGAVTTEAETKGSMGNFDRAMEHFVHHVDTVCLNEMEKDGSGELTTQQSANVKSTILNLFGPYENYLSTFPELLDSRVGGAFFETASPKFQHQQPCSQNRGSDTQVSADLTTPRQPTRSSRRPHH